MERSDDPDLTDDRVTSTWLADGIKIAGRQDDEGDQPHADTVVNVRKSTTMAASTT